MLGFNWGVWHLPQFFIRDGDSYRQAFPVFVLQVTAMSVAFAWLYARTNGSLLLTMLLHAAINNSKDIVPSGVLGGTARSDSTRRAFRGFRLRCFAPLPRTS